MFSSIHRGGNASSTTLTLPEPLPDRFSAIQNIFRQTISQSQRQTLTRCLFDAEADLRTYQAQINRLKATIILLEMREDNLKKTITKYRLSSICRLPLEILAHIFSFCCEENVIVPRISPVVIVLSGVCGRWRELVLATPRLWSSMTIDFETWDIEHDHEGHLWYSQKFYHLIEFFMERSKRELLDLEFSYPEDEILESLQAGFNCLLNQSSRWRSLTVPGSLTDDDSLFRCLRGRLPNLEHLLLKYDLDDFDEDSTAPIADDLALFSESSKLNSIHICGGILPTGFNCQFPWSQLQSLKLSDCDSTVEILALCKHVQLLEVDCEDRRSMDTSDSQTVTTLSKMQHVSFRGPSSFFQAFSFPSLSSLEIRGWFETIWDLDPLEHFFQSSLCPITSLSIEDLLIYDTQTIRLLALIPTLTNLSIQEGKSPKNRTITKAFWERLVVNTEDSRSRGFLPRLTDLNLTIFPLEPPNRQVLERVLASRHTTLRAFTLTFAVLQQQDISDYDSLQCFRDVGMRVHCSIKGARKGNV